MNKRISWILAILCPLLTLVGFFTIRTLERLVPSFPDFIMGDFHLTRKCNPLNAWDYQSSEFILDRVDLSRIKSGTYIHLQQDLILWNPYYPGLPRTELSREEISEFYQVLSDGVAFREINEVVGFNRLDHAPGKEATWVPLPEGEHYNDLFWNYIDQAVINRQVGLLQLELWDGQMVEVRIFPGEDGLAFDPRTGGSPWYFRGISHELPGSLEELQSRGVVEPIEILWPGKTSAQANAKAGRILGERYGKALEAVRKSTGVWKALGTIEQIRPALGQNTFSDWPGCSSVTLTLYIRGSKGEGAAIVRGDECFDITLVAEGKMMSGAWVRECP